jgi:hypothetical protein
MTVAEAEPVYRYSKDRKFTREEYWALADELSEAIRNKDKETVKRLNSIMPARAEIVKIFKDVYGKEYVLALGIDLTEANMRYGEGWLDEPGTWWSQR